MDAETKALVIGALLGLIPFILNLLTTLTSNRRTRKWQVDDQKLIDAKKIVQENIDIVKNELSIIRDRINTLNISQSGIDGIEKIVIEPKDIFNYMFSPDCIMSASFVSFELHKLLSEFTSCTLPLLRYFYSDEEKKKLNKGSFTTHKQFELLIFQQQIIYQKSIEILIDVSINLPYELVNKRNRIKLKGLLLHKPD